MTSPNALLIFAKYPEPKQVKTRLYPEISYEHAAGLYRAMVEDICDSVCNSSKFDTIVYFTPETKEEAFQEWLTSRITLKAQHEGELSERLTGAFDEQFNEGYKNVAAIGADCLILSEQDIGNAFRDLDSNDAVVGPTEDGGYYLIGLSRMIPELFNNISWSSEQVFSQTNRILHSLSLQSCTLEIKYDIDTYDDLKRFIQESCDGIAANMLNTLNYFEKYQVDSHRKHQFSHSVNDRK